MKHLHRDSFILPLQSGWRSHVLFGPIRRCYVGKRKFLRRIKWEHLHPGHICQRRFSSFGYLTFPPSLLEFLYLGLLLLDLIGSPPTQPFLNCTYLIHTTFNHYSLLNYLINSPNTHTSTHSWIGTNPTFILNIIHYWVLSL